MIIWWLSFILLDNQELFQLTKLKLSNIWIAYYANVNKNEKYALFFSIKPETIRSSFEIQTMSPIYKKLSPNSMTMLLPFRKTSGTIPGQQSLILITNANTSRKATDALIKPLSFFKE